MPKMSDNDASNSNSLKHAFFCGALAGTVEVGCNYPLFRLKLLFQTDGDVSEHPLNQLRKSLRNKQYAVAKTQLKPAVKSLYSGIGLCAFSMVPTTAIQVGVGQGTKELLAKHTSLSTNIQQLVAGSCGGAIAAGFASPTEYILAQLPKYRARYAPRPVSLWWVSQQMFRDHGHRVLTHGLFGTSIRDLLFTLAYSVWIEKVLSRVRQHVENPWVATAIANTAVGATVSVLSQPFDTIKAHQQDTNRFNFFAAAKDLHQKTLAKQPHLGVLGGMQGLHNGGFFRGARVISALSVIYAVNQHYADYFQLRK